MPKIKQKPKSIIFSNFAFYKTRENLTQKQIESILGMSHSTYERRKLCPADLTVRELERFAKYFKISVSDLFLDR